MKKKNFAVIAALLSLVAVFMVVSCEEPTTEGNGGDGGGTPTVPPELSGKWINQSGTTSPYTIVVLEFTSNQLIINDTQMTTYSYTDTSGEIKIGTSSSILDQTFCDSYTITAGVITFTGGTSATSYPSTNFYKVNPLTDGQWKDGVITSDSKGQVWYSFNVTDGTTYRMWWNDGYDSSSSGNGLKTLDVRVNGYYSSGVSAFTEGDTGWTTSAARYFTPNASQSGTVYVKVTPYSTSGVPTGTFGIVYSSTATERPNVPFIPPSATALTANVWKDGEITAASNGAVWYSFNVANGTVYNVWWNESSPNGNNIKTLNVSVRGFYSNGDTISGFTTTPTAWATAKSFTPTASGTVYLKVMPYTSGQTGTFGIVYNTELGTSRPPALFNPPSTPLAADEWKDGEITSGSGSEVWYSFSATSETPYYVWWNDGYSSGGNRLKTLDINVSAFNSEGTSISGFNNIDEAWSTAKTFTPTADGTIYLRVTPFSNGGTGTFGIVYSTANAKPPVPVNAVTPIALNAGVWKKGEITSASNGEVWYSFPVTGGTQYFVLWNDSYSGNGLFKTLDVKASAWYSSSGDNVFYDIDSAWSSSQSFTPNANGTVYVRVYSKTAGNVGTFDIVYSDTSAAIPGVPFRPNEGEPLNPITLTASQWTDGNITSGGDQWFRFTATASTQYIHVDFGTSTSFYVQVYDSNSTTNGSRQNMTSSSRYINRTLTVGQEYYIRVNGGNGSYKITFNKLNTPPLTVIPSAITLIESQWADGNIALNGEQWFKFTATAATQYIHVTFGTLANFDVQTYDSNGDRVENSTNLTGTTRITSRSVTSGQMYYIKVSPYYSNLSGSYQIAFNSSTSRPLPPAITLVFNQWADGNLITANGEQWFKFTATNDIIVIHAYYGTLLYNDGVNVQLYQSDAETAYGAVTRLNVTSGSTAKTPRSVTSGQVYYIKVWPYNTNSLGTYHIGFNTTDNTPPPF